MTIKKGKAVVQEIGLSKELCEVILNPLFENHQHFTVTFEKANGSLRHATCMMGVKKHLKGGNATYNGRDNDKGNVGIWERLRDEKGRFMKGQYRSFKKERIISIKVGGVKYYFD